jgi:hypothetical protein
MTLAPRPARERTPTLPGWVPDLPPPLERGVLERSTWRRGPIRVISDLVMAEAPDGSGDVVPQWHVSLTRNGKRPHLTDVRAVLRAFDLREAEEDNHYPGNARHFWLPVDPRCRVACECKAEEALVVEADGHRWTNPTDGSCRGCELQPLTGRPCPLHECGPVPP